jgi:hypothetical protein
MSYLQMKQIEQSIPFGKIERVFAKSFIPQ